MANTCKNLSGTIFQEKRVLILTDSIGSDIHYVYKADIIAKKGCGINNLRRFLINFNIDKYNGIIISIGTNDLSDKRQWYKYRANKHKPDFSLEPHPTTGVETLKARYRELLDLIQAKNPTATIELSPIIPRLFDYKVNLEYLKTVNNMIKEISLINGCYHDRTLITSFFKSGKPDPILYATDGLHLSQQGTNKLIRIYRLKAARLARTPNSTL